MKKFIKLDKYGQLYIDKVLFESYFPIIFTCVNNNKDIFISVCCQNNEKGCKWLLGKTDGISIVRMLQDKMTIRQLLLEHLSGKISVDYAKDTGYVIAYNNSDWDADSSCLPKEDSYMYAEDGEFDEEIDYFSSVNYCAPYVIEAVSIPGKVGRTLKVSGKLCTNIVINTEKYTNPERYKSVYDGTFHMVIEDLGLKMESADNSYHADAI